MNFMNMIGGTVLAVWALLCFFSLAVIGLIVWLVKRSKK